MIIHHHLSLSGPSLHLRGGYTEIYTEVAVSSRGVRESSRSATFLANCCFLSVLTLYRSFTASPELLRYQSFTWWEVTNWNPNIVYQLIFLHTRKAWKALTVGCQKKWASEHTERPLKVKGHVILSRLSETGLMIINKNKAKPSLKSPSTGACPVCCNRSGVF